MCWNSFYTFWDDFVEGWYRSGTSPNDAVSAAFRNDSGFTPCWHELPEPYLGHPEGARVVVVNYNPGAAGANETMKSYLRRDDPDAFLMHAFAHEFHGRYTAYQETWDELNETLIGHDPSVPGVTWWQGRCKWFRRFFNIPDLVTSQMFALEMCPYHSRYWNGRIPESLDDHYRQHVFGPAFAAVLENDLSCVVCVGKKIGTFLREHFNARSIAIWQNGVDPEGHNIREWPKTNTRNRKRTYELLEVPIGGWGLNTQEGSVKCLVVSAPGSNCLPSVEFVQIEVEILARIEGRNLP